MGPLEALHTWFDLRRSPAGSRRPWNGQHVIRERVSKDKFRRRRASFGCFGLLNLDGRCLKSELSYTTIEEFSSSHRYQEAG